MKKYMIYAGAALLLMGLASCEKEENFTLDNTFHLDNVLVARAEGFNDDLYKFNIELAEKGISGSEGSYTGSGKVVSYTMFCSKYYLNSSVYSAVVPGSEEDGSYIMSESTVYNVENGKVSQSGIKAGYVYVSNKDGKYRFGSTTTLDDGSTFKFVGGSSIDFPKLPKYKYCPELIGATSPDGTVFQVDFTNGEITIHMEFLGTELVDGEHMVDTGYKKGFLNDTYAAWGAVWDEGSRIIDAEGKVISYITDSKVTVSTKDDGSRRIEVDCDDIIYIYEGKI
ncbi:MAG: hypothetical protein ACI4TU_11590 [Candidatus Cryptobacteroides sp.]